MNAQEAIKILATRQGDVDTAIQELAAAVEQESKYGDPNSSLTDWIAAGQYFGDETVESIAAEWDDVD